MQKEAEYSASFFVPFCHVKRGCLTKMKCEAVLFSWIKNIPKTPETVKESGVCSIM